jgi:hypothetical protein
MMTVNTNAAEHLRLLVADVLLLFAKEVEAKTSAAMSTPYPPASRPGEFLHRRTGTAARSLRHSPTTREGVAAQGSISVYYDSSAWYARMWEEKDRLGLKHVFQQMAPDLVAVLRGT